MNANTLLYVTIVCHLFTHFLVAEEPKAIAGKVAGVPFREVAPPGAILVGMVLGIHRDTPHVPTTAIFSLQPIWEGATGRELGPAFGEAASQQVRVEARAGYAVERVLVHGGDRILGLRLVFAKIKGDRLNTQDTYESRWIGSRGETEQEIKGKSPFVTAVAGSIETGIRSIELEFSDRSSSIDPMPATPSGIFESTPDYELALAEVESWKVPVEIDNEVKGRPIKSITMSGRTLTPQRLEVIGRLPSLQVLTLSHTFGNLPPEAFAPLRKLAKLHSLDLEKCFWIRDAHLLVLRDLPSLERIDLSNTGVTSSGLAQLGNMKQLKEIILTSAKIDDSAIDTLRKFSRLDKLALKGTAITDEGLLRLTPLPNLTTLEVFSPVLGDAGFRVVESFPQLKNLAVSGELSGAALQPLVKLNLKTLTIGVQLSDEEFQIIAGQKELVELRLINVPISDDGFAPLESLKQLESIYIQRARLTGTGLRFLSADSLTSLNMHQCPLDDEGAAQLARFTKLKQLIIFRGQISDAALEHIAGMEHLESLSLQNCNLSDAALVHLQTLPRLKELDLTGCRITGSGFAHLADSKSLESITVQQNPITDIAFEHIGNISGLKLLNIDNTRVSNRGMAQLAKLKQLQVLTAAYTGITDAALTDLAPCEELVQLNVAGASVADESLLKLKPFKKLRMLGLTGTGVTNAGMEHLSVLPELNMLYAGQTRINRDGVKQLRKSHANLEIWLQPHGPEGF